MTLRRVLLAAALAGTGYAAVRLLVRHAPEGVRTAASDVVFTLRSAAREREAQLRDALGLAVDTDRALGNPAMDPADAAALLADPAGPRAP